MILSHSRRFLLFFFFSTQSIFLIAIMDKHFHDDTISMLVAFHKRFHVDMVDLHFWNHLSFFEWNEVSGPLILFAFWVFYMLFFSHPDASKKVLELLEPSERFGSCDIGPFLASLANTNGLKKVIRGMELRMGLFYRKSFWKLLWVDISQKNISPIRRVVNFFHNLVSFLTLFPIVVVLAPIKPMFWELVSCWKIRPLEKLVQFLKFVFLLFYYCLAGWLVFHNISIFSKILFFTVTSAIFHYQQSLNVIGIIGGCVAFLLRLLSQTRNEYIRLKMLIVEMAIDIHDEKVKERKQEREKKGSYEASVFAQQLVHTLSDGLPGIPKKLHNEIVQELKPVGTARAKFAVKLAVMSIFVVYIFTVMRALRMNEAAKAFDMAQALLTIVAVIVPSLLANLESDEDKALKSERHKYFVKQRIDDFLRRTDNGNYYKILNEEEEEKEKEEDEGEAEKVER